MSDIRGSGLPSRRTKFRKTKVIATVGPACDSDRVLQEMIIAGVNVTRLNFSHGNHEEHLVRIERIRRCASAVNANVAILVDTKGTEIRTGLLEGANVELVAQQEFNLYTDDRIGNTEGVSISYKNLPNEIKVGDPILLDDGAIRLQVLHCHPDYLCCTVVNSGMLGNRKGVNLPATKLQLSGLSAQDEKDLAFAALHDVDYIAASFVQSAKDISDIRKVLADNNNPNIPIIAKIENHTGVENLEEIIAAADGIMVARGDLGVEVPLEEVPNIQKKIIASTVLKGKPVITATQMLDSMERSPRPTRAEVSDVANAIFDGTSAVMLSGETAIGEYPVETVATMSSVALSAEAKLKEYGYLQRTIANENHVVTEAVSQAAKTMADHIKAAAVICLTESGFTSRMISKYRPECPILAITTNPEVVRRLSLNWGVLALHYQGEKNDDAKIDFAIQKARTLGYVQEGDIVVVTAGRIQKTGGTDLIRVVPVSV